jgi:ParB family chromosome partitioning protein
MARRSGLGRGLGALIPDQIEGGDPALVGTGLEGTSLEELDVDRIEPNHYQPRVHFEAASLEALAASIAQVGVLQPVIVRPSGDDRYELVAGERRWRAAQQAGLGSIPAIVRTVEDVDSLEQALVENLHRQDLNPLEEAAAYQQLLDDFGLTQEALATRVGRSRSAVANMLRLLHLSPKIQQFLIDGSLSAGHARALLGVDDEDRRRALADKAVADDLSVRKLEALVREDRPGPAPAREPGATRPAGLLELEQLLADHLDTKVEVTMGAKQGRITVIFADLDDLERIYRSIHGD